MVMVSYSNLRNGLRGGMTVQAPNASAWAVTYGYDAGNRLTSLASPAGVFGYSYASVTAGSAGTLINGTTLPNRARITNTFDAMARETGTWLSAGSVNEVVIIPAVPPQISPWPYPTDPASAELGTVNAEP